MQRAGQHAVMEALPLGLVRSRPDLVFPEDSGTPPTLRSPAPQTNPSTYESINLSTPHTHIAPNQTINLLLINHPVNQSNNSFQFCTAASTAAGACTI